MRVDEFRVQYVLVVDVRDRAAVVWVAAAAEDLLDEVLCKLPLDARERVRLELLLAGQSASQRPSQKRDQVGRGCNLSLQQSF